MIQTPRLTLRPPQAADAPAIATHLDDFQVSRWLARVPHPYRDADAEAFIAATRREAAAGQARIWALDRDGGVIGVVGFERLDGSPEFGFWLARAAWGRGLMTEAAAALLSWWFAWRPHRVLWSGAFCGNDASMALQRRFGFQTTGRKRQTCTATGTERAHVDTRLSALTYRPLGDGPTTPARGRRR